ncbi:MAG: NAD-dependent epimerase/dehydratase family protein [Acidimicrobiales bacterium]
MQGEKILVTGATGQVALPVALALAGPNEVWATARFTDTAARARLEAAGVRCVAVDLVEAGPSTLSASGLPDDFAYVLNFAVTKVGRWGPDLDGNAGSVAFLMEHCRKARAFLHCSSTAVYQPNGHHVFTEDDPLGDNHRVYAAFLPFMQTYSITKIAAEAVARYGARRWELPTTIARLNVPYGDNGGWPDIHLQMMLGGMAIPVHTDAPSRFNPIHEDDVVASLPGLLAAASVPASTLNWGGEPVTIEEWCAYLGELTGLEPAFAPTDQTIASVTVDLTRFHAVAGAPTVGWREGMRRMVAVRHPDLMGTASSVDA